MTVVKRGIPILCLFLVLALPTAYAACYADNCGFCTDECTVEGGLGPGAGCGDGERCVTSDCLCCVGGSTDPPTPGRPENVGRLRCVPDGVVTEVNCANGIDDDGDSDIDCADSECAGFSNVVTGSQTSHDWDAPQDVVGKASAEKEGFLRPATFTPEPFTNYYAQITEQERVCVESCQPGPDGEEYCSQCRLWKWLEVVERDSSTIVGRSSDWAPCYDDGGDGCDDPDVTTDTTALWTWENGTMCEGDIPPPPQSAFRGDCYIADVCAPNDIDVMHVDNVDNSHAALTSVITNYRVCCPVENIEARCSPRSTTFLSLSDTFNAQVEQPRQGNYPEEVCFLPVEGQRITCSYKSACDADETCIIAMSGATNAHVQECGIGTYDTKVCCGFGAVEEYCGDGIVQPGEECDDGNTIDTDGCTNACTRGECRDTTPAYTADDLCPDGAPRRNLCDAERADRGVAAAESMNVYYGERNRALFTLDESVKLRYQAALFNFFEGSAFDGNTLIERQLQYDTASSDLTPLDSVYITWILESYTADLTPANRDGLTALLDAPEDIAVATESDSFLRDITVYFRALRNGNLECEDSQPIVSALRVKGDEGWRSEINQEALADVVIGLSTLYANTPNASVKVLAEMNLDVIFARFAAQMTNGIFGGVRENDWVDTWAFHPYESPWYGWSYLLFGEPDDVHLSEPSILIAGYCAHDAVRSVLDSRRVRLDDLELNETFASRSGNFYSYVSQEYALSGTVDVADSTASLRPFSSRITLRMPDHPKQLLTLTTATADWNDPENGADEALVYTERDLAIGRLGGDECREPHAFVANSYEISGDPDGEGLRLICYGVCSGEESDFADSVYVALRFAGPTEVDTTQGRYAPLGGQIGEGWGGVDDSGTIIYSRGNQRDIFSVEVIPRAYLNAVAAEHPYRNPLDFLWYELYDAVLRDTSLGYTGGRVEYMTRLQGGEKTYSYDPGRELRVDNTLVEPSGYAPRYTKITDVDYTHIERTDRWEIKGTLQGSLSRRLWLNFTADTLAGLKDANPLDTTWACSGTSGGSGLGDTRPPETIEERLAWMADSMMQDAGGSEYSLDCGPPSEVLPNYEYFKGTDLIQAACVMEVETYRKVGLLYNPMLPRVQLILQQSNLYYPYLEPDDNEEIDITMCDDALEETGLDFLRCNDADFFIQSPAYGKMSSWVSPDAAALVMCNEPNCFTNGPLDSWIDFFTMLFGGGEVEEGADPDVTGFRRGYFYRDDAEKKVRARFLTDSRVEILYMNLVQSVESLLNRLPPGSVYKKGELDGDYVQYFFMDEEMLDEYSWRAVTGALRINTSLSGDPSQFTSICGDGIVDFGEECDPGNSDYPRRCSVGPNNMTCTSGCLIDLSQCGEVCEDKDGDGANVTLRPDANCGAPSQLDCYDADPETVTVYGADGTPYDCALVTRETGCKAPPTSACPQCVSPGMVDEVCDDGADNNCNGVSEEDEGCPPSPDPDPDPDDSVICDGFTPGCPYVCESNGVQEFGGMYLESYNGTCEPNPATGSCTCPLGYDSHQVYGSIYETPDQPWIRGDRMVHVCMRPWRGEPTYDFGGMFARGPSWSCPNPNPLTGECNCPSGYTQHGWSRPWQDPYYWGFCYRDATGDTESMFAGMYGYQHPYEWPAHEDPYTLNPGNWQRPREQMQCVPNPLTGDCSCPDGTHPYPLVGENKIDRPLFYCAKFPVSVRPQPETITYCDEMRAGQAAYPEGDGIAWDWTQLEGVDGEKCSGCPSCADRRYVIRHGDYTSGNQACIERGHEYAEFQSPQQRHCGVYCNVFQRYWDGSNWRKGECRDYYANRVDCCTDIVLPPDNT